MPREALPPFGMLRYPTALTLYNGYLGLGASLSDSVLAQLDLLGASSCTPLCERRKLEQTEGWLTVVMSE